MIIIIINFFKSWLANTVAIIKKANFRPLGGWGVLETSYWGCAARKGVHYRTPSLTKGTLFGRFRQGYAFRQVWSKKSQRLVIPIEKLKILVILV